MEEEVTEEEVMEEVVEEGEKEKDGEDYYYLELLAIII